jgi:hypothetical protein
MATTRKRLEEVSVQALDPARLEPLIGEERMQRFEVAAEDAPSHRRPLRAQRQLDRRSLTSTACRRLPPRGRLAA